MLNLLGLLKPGSLVEKKKFSSTTGLRSANVATNANNTLIESRRLRVFTGFYR